MAGSKIFWLLTTAFLLSLLVIFSLFFTSPLWLPVAIGFSGAFLYFYLYLFNLWLAEQIKWASTKVAVLVGFVLRLTVISVFLLLTAVVSQASIRLVVLTFLLGHTALFLLTQLSLVFLPVKEGV
jgi:hypothetical protein